MSFIKFSLYLLLILTITMKTLAYPSRPGDKIHFQDSAELEEELNIDRRAEPAYRDNRNHRGRAVGHQKQLNGPTFEQGIPGVYPIRGPPSTPLVIPTHPGQGVGVGLQKHKPMEINTPVSKPPEQQPVYYHYVGNPFLAKAQTGTSTTTSTTNKYTAPVFPGLTNQLPSSDKPIATTTTTFNPRRIDLLYGSNLLEEDARREGQIETTTDVSFNDRGLFDTAPHCQPGHILVNNKCRLAV